MRSSSVLIVTFFASLLALTPATAQTQPESAPGAVPRLIRLNGTLSAAELKPGGGLVGVELAIYKEETGGVALWSEIQNVEPDSTGHFTVLLGSTKNGGLPPDVLGFGEPRWLSVTPVGGQAQPPVLLVSVPYALRAEEAVRIAGSPASDFVRKGDLTDSVREAIRTIQPEAATGHATPNASSGPTTFTGSTTNQIVSVQQTGTGKAIVATAASGIGTNSTGGTTGVYGTATAATGIGVRGSGVTAGVYGSASSATGIGVQGVATNTSGKSTGVSGISASAAGTGVSGKGSAFGVTGTAANAGGIGVMGTSTDIASINGNDFGVQGIANDSTGAGVNGTNKALTGNAWGISGNSSSTSTSAAAINGFEGASMGQVYGVSGGTNSSGSFAAGVNGYEGATTGQVFGVNGGTNSTGNGSAAVNGNEGATAGTVYGVSGNAQSTGNGSAGVSGFETATTGQVFGVNGSANSTGQYSAAINGFEAAATGNVFGVNGGTNSTGNGAAGVNGYEGAATGQVFGVSGGTNSAGNGSAAVNGYEGSTTGQVYGVNGSSQSPNGIGVNGNNSAGTGPTIGVQGSSSSPQGYGISGTSPNVAVVGFNQNCSASGCTLATGVGGQFITGAGGTVIQGLSGPDLNSLNSVFNIDSTGKGYFNGGVSSTINNPAINVFVATNNATSGSAGPIVGITYSPNAAGIGGYNYSDIGRRCNLRRRPWRRRRRVLCVEYGGGLAGAFSGGVQVTGDLSVTGSISGSVKNFKIDDPLDPARKSLYHASLESSEMANIYSGNVILDRKGQAVVDLPEWFEALNGDFRYQLTTIGRPLRVYRAGNSESPVQNRRRPRGYESVLASHRRAARRLGASASAAGGGRKGAALDGGPGPQLIRQPQRKLNLPRVLRRKNLPERQRLIRERVR